MSGNVVVERYEAILNSPAKFDWARDAVSRSRIVLYYRIEKDWDFSIIYFFDDKDSDVIGKDFGVTAWAAADAAEYERYLHLLQTEASISFKYEGDEGGGTLKRFSLATGFEETGEGHVDRDSEANA